MKFIFLICLLPFGCNDSSRESVKNDSNTAIATASIILEELKDTTTVEIDEYRITDKMIADNLTVNSKSPTDQVLFESETSNEIIYMFVATDYYRATSIHFEPGKSEKILLIEDFKTIQESIDDKSFSSATINHSYFQTKKGLKLGDSKKHVIEIYGSMNQTSTKQNLQILQWDYFGEELLAYEENTENYRIAKNSLGHQAKLIFENDKLIGILFKNHIP